MRHMWKRLSIDDTSLELDPSSLNDVGDMGHGSSFS